MRPASEDQINAREHPSGESAAEHEAKDAACPGSERPRLGDEPSEPAPVAFEGDDGVSALERLRDVSAVRHGELEEAVASRPRCAHASEHEPPDDPARSTDDDHDAHPHTDGEAVPDPPTRREEDERVVISRFGARRNPRDDGHGP